MTSLLKALEVCGDDGKAFRWRALCHQRGWRPTKIWPALINRQEGIGTRSERGKLARFVAHEIGQLREVVRQLHAREIVRDEFCERAIHTPQPLIAF